MGNSRLMALACGLLAAAAAMPLSAATCKATSGDRTLALVELYTSEGCDSCPQADRWLSSLGMSGIAPDGVVPIALHVDYWDYIGWKDPYAKHIFSVRQRKQAQITRSPVVYTPQVRLQGRDFRRWGTGEFGKAVASINAAAPRANIGLELLSAGAKNFKVRISVELLDAAQAKDAEFYLATYESGLTSRVASGENRGKTLTHDFVIREWLGPIGFGKVKNISDLQELPVPPKAVPGRFGVVAFVQNRRSGAVLQALMLPACAERFPGARG